MGQRISGDVERVKHGSEIEFFNNLIIDLKLVDLGRDPRSPITMARLELATDMVARLSRCKERVCYR